MSTIRIISTSKDGLSRQVVLIQEIDGHRFSITRHERLHGGKWKCQQ